MSYLESIALIALGAAFAILLLGKTGARDWLVLHSPPILSEAVSCDFCLSFWASALISVGMFFVTGQDYYLYLPIFTTPITRLLI